VKKLCRGTAQSETGAEIRLNHALNSVPVRENVARDQLPMNPTKVQKLNWGSESAGRVTLSGRTRLGIDRGKVGPTHQRLVLRQDICRCHKPSLCQKSVWMGESGADEANPNSCHWRDYKAVRLQGIYYGLFFDDNQCLLIDYVNSRLDQSITRLGDGHHESGIWSRSYCHLRQGGEILDWYHPERKSL